MQTFRGAGFPALDLESVASLDFRRIGTGFLHI